MLMSEAGLDIFDGEYVHQFQPGPNTQFTSNSRSTEFKDILLWSMSQMITKTIPIGTRIVISYAMKWGHLILSLMESQFKQTVT